MKKISAIIFFLLTFLLFPSSAFAWPIIGDVTQINNNTVQIDNIGTGWTGCNGFWYAQLYGSNDNFTYPLAGGTLGNNLTGSSCQTISDTSIQITLTWPYGFYYYPQTYKIFYGNNNNYDNGHMTNNFTVSSATPPQDNKTYTTLFSDDFTGIDGTTLTAHNSSWVVRSGPEAKIQNNQLAVPAQSEFYLPNYASTSDQCLSFDIQFPLVSGYYFWTRNNNGGNGFLSYINSDNSTYGIYDISNGSATYINSGSYLFPTSGMHNIKQCSIGSNTVIYLDNISFASGISNDNPVGTGAMYGPGYSTSPNLVDNVVFQSVSTNNAPVLGSINVTTNPVQLNNNTSASAPFTDLDTADTHTAFWNWGDSATSSGVVIEANGSGTVSGSHAYTTTGVYTVSLTVTDSHGASATANYQYIVVYDPTAGFVTGAGSFISPLGAYAADPTLTGKFKFGIQAKYKNGALTGKAKLEFKDDIIEFENTSFQWMVITGNKAQLLGTGTQEHKAGTYVFLITVLDSGESQISDKIRIEIIDPAGNIIYDSQPGDSYTADPITPISSGSIKIHQ